MGRKIKISPAALKDIQTGADYYNSKQKGLGKRFVNTAHDTFIKISDMPEAASISHDDVRYKIMDKFPYIVIYTFDEHLIYIFRVFHTSLDPAAL